MIYTLRYFLWASIQARFVIDVLQQRTIIDTQERQRINVSFWDQDTPHVLPQQNVNTRNASHESIESKYVASWSVQGMIPFTLLIFACYSMTRNDPNDSKVFLSPWTFAQMLCLWNKHCYPSSCFSFRPHPPRHCIPVFLLGRKQMFCLQTVIKVIGQLIKGCSQCKQISKSSPS